mmetsp:Transcript_67254/g.105891  ORF Transcript_67254/g.105891 Transcript_67254/m.105891 type:complete len:475 (+) Transcript_67254:54-1478(+)
MAKIVELPRAKYLQPIDSKEIMGDRERPKVDPETGLPDKLLAYQISEDPRIMVYPHFFSEAECDHLVGLVEGVWMPSLVGGGEKQPAADQVKQGQVENYVGQTRTSWSCMTRYSQTSVLERLEHRLASIAGLPNGVAQLERMNMVRYTPGEFFNEHHDGKFRPLTIFVYLNDLPDDATEGDTFFPILGYSFRPRKGTAIMWPNTVDGTKEDSRMVHAGRAPSRGVKYGVNCFTNETSMRELVPIPAEVSLEDSVVIKVADLADGPQELGDNGQPILKLYRVVEDPKLVAVPGFMTPAEVQHIMDKVRDIKISPSGPFAKGTQMIHQFEFAATEEIEAIESRCTAVIGESLDNLAKLRVVRPGTEFGLCNRGCGKYHIYVCLSEADEVFFPRLGIRFQMVAGDAISIPNANFATGMSREEMRTVRVHRFDESAPVIGLDCYFHDNPLRAQQKVRRFRTDAEIAEADRESRLAENN